MKGQERPMHPARFRKSAVEATDRAFGAFGTASLKSRPLHPPTATAGPDHINPFRRTDPGKGCPAQKPVSPYTPAQAPQR